jgi:hypothetical protein
VHVSAWLILRPHLRRDATDCHASSLGEAPLTASLYAPKPRSSRRSTLRMRVGGTLAPRWQTSGVSHHVGGTCELPQLTLGRMDGKLLVFALANTFLYTFSYTFSYRSGNMARTSLPGDRKSPDYEEVHLGFRGVRSSPLFDGAGWSKRCRRAGFGSSGSTLRALHHGD